MKKLIAISVVFALVAGVAFAVDVTGTVFGHVNVLQGTTSKSDDKVRSSGGMDRVRVDGSGEAGDGSFGGYVRLQQGGLYDGPEWDWGSMSFITDDQNRRTTVTGVGIDTANAWWKPLDQFKLIIGNNSDGQWGKEGVTGWGFNQMPNDSSIATNYGIWYGNGWGSSLYPGGPPIHNRYTFFEGFVEYGALMEITPMDMVGINIAIPFMPGGKTNESADVFKAAVFQVNLNFDFGNIAITYDGGGRAVTAQDDGGAIFGYFGGTFGDLGIDFGVSYHLTDTDKADIKHPIGVGVGVKYATDSFGVKFRTTAALAGDDKNMYINSSVLPYFNISDNLAAFVNIGLGMIMPDVGDNIMGWYFNPYLRVGAEWGPTFYFGIKVESSGVKEGSDTPINWAVPVSLMVSF